MTITYKFTSNAGIDRLGYMAVGEEKTSNPGEPLKNFLDRVFQKHADELSVSGENDEQITPDEASLEAGPQTLRVGPGPLYMNIGTLEMVNE